MAVAAKFNHTVPFGWPRPVVRRQNENGSHIAVYITEEEPRPSGYLNVFEYDLSDNEFEIHPGEQICISWLSTSNPARYSLAYHQGIAMAVGLVKNLDVNMITTLTSEIDSDNSTTPAGLLITSATSTSEINSGSTSASTNNVITIKTTAVEVVNNILSSSQRDQSVIPIVTGVLCTIGALIILAVSITLIIVIYRCMCKRNTKTSLAMANHTEILTEVHVDVNQAYATIAETDSTNDVQQTECIEMDSNQAYIAHSEVKKEQGAGTVECIEVETNQAYVTSTVPTEPNVAYGTQLPQVHDYEYVGLT